MNSLGKPTTKKSGKYRGDRSKFAGMNFLVNPTTKSEKYSGIGLNVPE